MITGVIKYQVRGGTLVVTLPCSLYDLREHLASIGITSEASKLTVSGTENIKVQLMAEEPIGVKYLIEEVHRYRLAIENYARACKAAEDEDYEMPEDGEWER